MFDNIREDFRTHDSSLRDGGFWALFVYRFGVWSMNRRFPPWRWFTSRVYGVLRTIAQQLTGVLLERTTKIGKRFHIVHCGTIHIHPDVVFGDRCGIMHNVTLGTNMGDDVPVIGDDVFIGCGASILGKVKIGDGARIAANSLVISNVPAGSVAMGVPARATPNLSFLRDKKPAKKSVEGSD